MKPKTISYSESKESVNEIGLKSWRKAGVEIELDDTDDVKFAYEKAKMMVNDTLSPHSWIGDFGIITPSPVGDIAYPPNVIYATNPSALPTIDTQKEKIEIAIDNCESLYELDLLMGDVAKHNLVPQYLEKKKQLK
jgi:hypothetical protein